MATTRPGDAMAAAHDSEPALAGSGAGRGTGGRQSDAAGSLPQGLGLGSTRLKAAGETPPEHRVKPDPPPLPTAGRAAHGRGEDAPPPGLARQDPALLPRAGSAAQASSREPETLRVPGATASPGNRGRNVPAHLDTPVQLGQREPDLSASQESGGHGEVAPVRSAAGHRCQPWTTTPTGAPVWRLRALPVCASSETELDRWLQRLIPDPEACLPGPVAVIARRQRFGRGQQGRQWSSPAGGVWLSAALPWPADPAGAAAPGLAVAVGLALQLEALGLEVRLKWPNDLLIAGPGGQPAKLAGLLPRLRLHGGRIRWARLGVGLNGANPVPPGATNLRGLLDAGQLRPERLTARVLQALEWAMAVADQPTWVRQQAEARLLVAPGSWQGAAEGWQPHGLADDGALVLARGEERQLLRRRFD